ncbi:hypothetical protein FHT86_003524 [Rhizobium sp. BK313]|uniref:hypothetical protein n=1 Tax=Rhizobium sp. BK313 TaxID=2587081 RepID=UPI00105D7436|nr:hypothetical protein [Rhizobium sp. BK313]MBB3455225.1 hypothetical protein [Rhizobium sp. BK313]
MKTYLAMLFMLFFSDIVYAQQIDCSLLLKPNNVSFQSSESLKLSYLQLITKDNFAESKQAFDSGGSIIVDGLPMSGYANYSDFSQHRQHEFEKYSFNYSRDNSEKYVASTVDDNARAAYIKCQKIAQQGSIGLRAYVERVTDTHVSISLHWSPPPNGAGTRLTFVPVSGVIAASAHFPTHIAANATLPVEVDRTAGKAFSLTVAAKDYQPVYIDVPLPPVVIDAPAWSHSGFKPRFTVLVHAQNIGDMTGTEGSWVGTKGRGLRLEGIQITGLTDVPNLSLQYMCHLQNIGDTPWYSEGQFCGTRGQSRRMEGFAIRLTGAPADEFDVSYQCHIAKQGDSQTFYNGQFCGTRGLGRSVESVDIVVTHK